MAGVYRQDRSTQNSYRDPNLLNVNNANSAASMAMNTSSAGNVNPYAEILLPVTNLVEQAGFLTNLSYEQKMEKLVEWRTKGSSHFSATSSIAHSWVMARDALILQFLARNQCRRCHQGPIVFPAPYTQQVTAHHPLPVEAKKKYVRLLRAMDAPPEMLSKEILEGFAKELRVIENLFWESAIGVPGCGLGSWCGYRVEVEI